MAVYKRIIPRLDIKGPNLVKGINLEGLRVLGKPERFSKFYYENGADELLYIDIVASLYNRNNLLEIVRRTSKEIFIPLTVGGGLRTLEDIQKVLFAGADKVSLNTAAIRKPEIIKESAKRFGSSTIVVSIEAKKKTRNSYEAYIDNGREPTGIDCFGWTRKDEDLGAGEILITSIDREGTRRGFDLELTKKIADSVQIPTIACGGAGNTKQVYDVLAEGKADAVCIASMLHYKYIKENFFKDDFSTEGNIDFLEKQVSQVQGATLIEIKEYLVHHGIKCRYKQEEKGKNKNE